uniref:Uncharacterized protein n=1 Tax=Octopus bimaculoides TaxID=37653 RepID=A0A0L8IGL9_OCTBM
MCVVIDMTTSMAWYVTILLVWQLTWLDILQLTFNMFNVTCSACQDSIYH